MTESQRIILYTKRAFPALYREMVMTRPDLIERANTGEMAGLGGLGGWLDDLTDFVDKAGTIKGKVDAYKKGASKAAKTPAPVIIQQVPQKTDWTKYLVPAGIGVGITGLVMFLRGKRR